MRKQDQAARIAAFSWTATIEPENSELAKRIRRAITAAVRKERERCGEVARQIKLKSFHTNRASVFVCDDILDAIYRPEPQARRMGAKATKAIRKGKA